jgi:polysaccharide export outer membrane protein
VQSSNDEEFEVMAMVLIKKISMILAGMLVLAAIGVGQNTDTSTGDAQNTMPARPMPVKDGASAEPTQSVNNGKPAADGADDILPYYDNYLKEYHLGPGDIISVDVFGQCPEYCRTGIAIPPNARISYPLIKEGLMVAGMTVEQVAAEITKKLDEYIIDPSVTVTLNKAGSARYSVMGNVTSPGVHIMDRKISVYEAITDAGGVTRRGDKNKVVIVSYAKNGRLSKRNVSLADMEKGKADMVYLSPGDQVFVSGKGFSITKVLEIVSRGSSALSLFGIPFGLPSYGIPYGLP